MWYLAILVAFGASTVNGQDIITVNCIPNLVSTSLIGRTTLSTLTLENIVCCIRLDPNIQLTDNVVFLVGLRDVVTSLDPSSININIPPLFSNFSNSGFFLSINGTVINLCPLNANLLDVIRIGDNPACLINPNLPFCNAPLIGVGPYRIIVLVYRNGTLLAITRPSPDIILRNPKDFRSIDTTTTKHSASMIVITTVLPILLALSLVIFSTMLLMKCCCCSIFTPTKCQREQSE